MATQDNDIRIYFGGAIKALGNGLLEGMLIANTDEDTKDLHEEFFDETTELHLDDYPIGEGMRALYQHGLDETVGIRKIGHVVKSRVDEKGVWLRAQIDLNDEYNQMIYELAESGKLGWSSGALPQSVKVADNGLITNWAVIEASLTPTPAMPMMTKIQTTKSLLTAQARKEASNEPKDVIADETTNDNSDNDDEVNKMEMTDEKLVELIKLALEEYNSSKMEDEEDLEEDEAMASIDTAKMEDEDEDMDEEEKSKAYAQLIAKSIYALGESKRAERETAKSVTRKAMQAEKARIGRNLKEQKPLGAFVGDNPNKQNAHTGIEVRSQFADWTPADFSFAAGLARMTRGTNRQLDFVPDQKFYREFADKATQANQRGEFNLSRRAIKGINAIKADELDYSTQTGFGDEWVPELWSDNVWDKPRLDNVIVPAFQQIEMPSEPYLYPVESTDPTVNAVAETTDEDQLGRNDANSAIPDSKIGTAKVQFNSKKHALRVNISAELEEDGIARLMPKFREQSERSILDAHDNVVLNGDTSTSGNINLDGGTPTVQNYTSYDGILHQALITATTNALNGQGAAPSLANIRAIRALLGNAQGFNPANLAIFTDFQTYMKLLSMDEVVTLDKMGPNATIKTGSLGLIDGINVFVSGQMALADTDGKITNGGNTTDTGRLAMVYTPDWFIGYRRRVVQHVNFLPYADSWELIMTVRHAFTSRSYSGAGAQQSTDDSVAVLYNIGV